MSELKQELETLIAGQQSDDPGVRALFGGGKMLLLLRFIAENWEVIKEVIDKFQASSSDAKTASARSMGIDWLELLRYIADNWDMILGLVELLLSRNEKGPSAL